MLKKIWWILYIIVMGCLAISPYSGVLVSMLLFIILFIMLCFLIMFKGKSTLIKKLDPQSPNYRFQVATSQRLKWAPIVLMIFPIAFYIMGAYVLVVGLSKGNQPPIKPLIHFANPVLVSWICSILSTPIFILSLIGYFQLTFGYANDIPKLKKKMLD